jgi:hypothetical protein
MCFSWQWFLELLIMVIVIIGAFKIWNVIWPLIVEWMGGLGKYANAVVAIIKIIIICLILIWVVIFAFDAIQCLLGKGGGIKLPGR